MLQNTSSQTCSKVTFGETTSTSAIERFMSKYRIIIDFRDSLGYYEGMRIDGAATFEQIARVLRNMQILCNRSKDTPKVKIKSGIFGIQLIEGSIQNCLDAVKQTPQEFQFNHNENNNE